MPANIRQTAKRELDRARNNLDMAMTHIARVAETYKEQHPEISEPLELMGGTLVACQDVLYGVNEKI